MSSWDTSTGLLDSFTLVVKEAWFGKREQFGENLLLNLKGSAIVEGVEVDPEHDEIFTCGATWQAGQGGALAVSTTGAEMFNANSKIGRLINSIADLGDEVKATMQARGETFEADTWTGLEIDLERVKVGTYEDQKTGEIKDSMALVATGVRESSEQAAAPAKTEAAGSNSGGGALRKLVVAHAKKYDNNDDFVAGVLDAEVFKKAADVESDEELLDAIIDGSIFAEAH